MSGDARKPEPIGYATVRERSAAVRLWLRRAAFAFAVYVVAYLVLSRRGYAEAASFRLKGFYYLPPMPPWRVPCWESVEFGLLGPLFRPLNALDEWIGTGMPQGSCVLLGVS
jgi:hypothetical protein